MTARKGPGGLDGVSAIAAVARGDTTAADLHEDAMSRVGEWEPLLGAVTESISYRPAPSGPLKGITIGIKNYIDVAGYRNWWGLQAHGMDAIPVDEDATVVSRLRKSGATLVCTTSAPFIGAPGGVTPQTRNPRSPDRVSGGSSGGSASAVAAGLVHGALGSDAGGSIRIPAACCGVVGLQTTRGLVPLTGTGGLTYSIGNVGPLAASTDDARLLLDAIVGFDDQDPHSVEIDSIARWDGSVLRVGMPVEMVEWNLDPEVAAMLDMVVAMLRSDGHLIDRISLPSLRESMELGPGVIGVVESGVIIADRFYDIMHDRPEMLAAVELSKQVSGPNLARAEHRVALMRAQVRRVFTEYDILIMPTLPCRVPEQASVHREVEVEVGGAKEQRTSALTRLVNPWNLAGVPAGSLPVTTDSHDAPVSLQIVGPSFSDWRILDVMGYLEAMSGGRWDTVAPAI